MTELTNFEKAQSYALLAENTPEDRPERFDQAHRLAQVFATLAQIEMQKAAVEAANHMVEITEGTYGDLNGARLDTADGDSDPEFDTNVVIQIQTMESGTGSRVWKDTAWDTLWEAQNEFPDEVYRAARVEVLS